MPDSSLLSQMRAVTISREYGSGGGEIAQRLAHRLGWSLIDHEVVVQVAQKLGISEAEAAAHDERAEGILTRILTSMQGVNPALVTVPMYQQNDENIYRDALHHVIQAAIQKGHVIIVGRGSQALLGQHRDVLHIRIVAPLKQRIAYVMRREGLNENDARERIQLKDRDRMRYLQAEHHLSSADPHLYDLTINTSILSLDHAVDLIALALQHKAAQLATPLAELGPVTGLTRYATQPGDFRPPESLQ